MQFFMFESMYKFSVLKVSIVFVYAEHFVQGHNKIIIMALHFETASFPVQDFLNLHPPVWWKIIERILVKGDSKIDGDINSEI